MEASFSTYLHEVPSFENGEGGIRTLGTALRSVQQISNLPLSTTQPPLQNTEASPNVAESKWISQES